VIGIIPLTKPYFGKEEISQVKQVLDSGIVAGLGPKTKILENIFSKYVKTPHSFAVNNCTAALHLAMLALDIKKGDEVLVADYSFPSTGHAVLYVGAKPVFIDVDPLTYNMNPSLLEEKINKRTKAIIPVHTFGQSADMDRIMRIAKKHGLKVVEDAAWGFGTRFKGKPVGTFGDIGCFSFQGRKGITTGEGGMVAVKNGAVANKVRIFSRIGSEPYVEDGINLLRFTTLGYNFKLSDIAAGIGIAQIKLFPKMTKKRQALAKYYDEKLDSIPFLDKPYLSKKSNHTYPAYVCLAKDGKTRNGLIRELMKRKIQTQIGTYALHLQPIYKTKKRCPVSADIFRRAIALPLYYEMTHKNIDEVISAIRKIGVR